MPARKFAVIALLLLFAAARANAQEFLLTGSNLEDGAAGVPLVDSIFFHFNKKLPFNSLFTSKVHFEPRRDAFRRYVFLDADRQHPRFTIEHEPDTDYAVFVYGVQSEQGEAMARPFTLNYTTEEEHGTHRVSGTAAIGDRVAAATEAPAQRLRRMIADAFPEEVPQTLPYRGADGELAHGKRVGAAPLRAAVSRALDASAADLVRTVVFLMDYYALDEDVWAVRAASALNTENEFAFDHVRDGTYWPVAINYAGDDGEIIGAYGFYDPDGNLEPDAVTVDGGGMMGIDVTLFPFQAETMGDRLAVARDRAAEVAGDQRLLNVTAVPVGTDGAAFTWYYTFYSPEQDRATLITAGAVDIQLYEFGAGEYQRTQQAIGSTFVDSDEALAIASENGGAAFVDEHGADSVTVDIRGGDLEMDPRPRRPSIFWWVRYEALGSSDEMEVFIDMETGEVLEAVPVSSETEREQPRRFVLRGNYPNPFAGATTIDYELSTAADVSLTVHDVLGREVQTLVEGFQPAGRHTATWNAATAPAGLYLCRLGANGTVSTRRMIHIK